MKHALIDRVSEAGQISGARKSWACRELTAGGDVDEIIAESNRSDADERARKSSEFQSTVAYLKSEAEEPARRKAENLKEILATIFWPREQRPRTPGPADAEVRDVAGSELPVTRDRVSHPCPSRLMTAGNRG